MNEAYMHKVLKLAITAGEILMKSGAEVYRVEDTIVRMCKACGVETAEVFTTPAGLFVSLGSEDAEVPAVTFIRRVKGQVTDMTKISRINRFSRTFSANEETIDAALEQIQRIDAGRQYPLPVKLLGAAMVAFCFCFFFGGALLDASIAFFAGGISYTLSSYLNRYDINYFIHGFLCCAAAAIIAAFASGLIPQANYTMIITGALMIYVPGVAITNSIRDFLSGDMLSGLSRLTEAILTAASLALGVGIVTQFWHAMGGVIL